MTRIFISYRRSDTKWAAGRIYDEIAKVLGRDNIFFDVSSIDPGEDFVLRISQIVGVCDILLAIIGPGWLSAQDKSGKRRLDDPLDLIRVEVAAALQRNIRVIPILVDGAEMPDARELPADLTALARRNAHDVSFARFHADLESFVRVLEKILAGPSAQAPTVQQVERAQATAETERPVAKELPFTICIETLGGVASPLLKKGTRLPAEASETYSTAADNQSQVEVKLSIGNRAMAKDNVLVGVFVLDGIPPAQRGIPQIKITTVVDPSLLLTVTAEDQASGHKQVLDAVDLTRIEISPETDAAETTPQAEVPEAFEAPTGFRDMFSQFFGASKGAGAARGEKAQAGGKDVTLDLAVTFEEAMSGAVKTVEALGKRLQVRVPPGIDSGTRLRIREVVDGAKPGEKAGDLYLTLRVGEHPKYTRQGNDLYYVAPISQAAARRGVMLTLPPLGTRKALELKVPAGSQMGTRIRMAGQGLPNVRNADQFGDLYVTLEAKAGD